MNAIHSMPVSPNATEFPTFQITVYDVCHSSFSSERLY